LVRVTYSGSTIDGKMANNGKLAMKQRIVVKFGTSVLTEGTRRLSPSRMVDLARQCAALHEAGHELILCTSGAMAAGREHLGYPDLPATIATKQMLAAVGQSRLMMMWERFFEIYGLTVGQILLTHGDVASRGRFLNAQDTLQALLAHRIIPIINENDAVATEEIKIGDNDNLSALVAVLADADVLILLTDQPGLFTADPRENPSAELIAEVNVIDDALRALASGSRTGLGVGGMVTKLEAAVIARRAGIRVVIARGLEPDVLPRIASGEALGTRFEASPSVTQGQPPENRKRWILAGVVHTGYIVVDEGAANALQHQGRSLLPAGVVAVEGSFDRGDTVSIHSRDAAHPAGLEIARGIARYPSEDLSRIKGYHSDRIAEILGYTYGSAAVHRNDLILMRDA
jgi:glutamate 5-kinase